MDTFCDSHCQATAKEAGGAAAHAESEIAKKYNLIHFPSHHYHSALPLRPRSHYGKATTMVTVTFTAMAKKMQ